MATSASSDEFSDDNMNRTIVNSSHGVGQSSQMQPPSADVNDIGTRPTVGNAQSTSSTQSREPRTLEMPPPNDRMRVRESHRTIGQPQPSTNMPPLSCLPTMTMQANNNSSIVIGQQQHASDVTDTDEQNASRNLREELRLANSLPPVDIDRTRDPPISDGQQSVPPAPPTDGLRQSQTSEIGQMSIVELQRRIQSLQREAEHYREINHTLRMSNDGYVREHRLPQSDFSSHTSPEFRGFGHDTSRRQAVVGQPNQTAEPMQVHASSQMQSEQMTTSMMGAAATPRVNTASYAQPMQHTGAQHLVATQPRSVQHQQAAISQAYTAEYASAFAHSHQRPPVLPTQYAHAARQSRPAEPSQRQVVAQSQTQFAQQASQIANQQMAIGQTYVSGFGGTLPPAQPMPAVAPYTGTFAAAGHLPTYVPRYAPQYLAAPTTPYSLASYYVDMYKQPQSFCQPGGNAAVPQPQSAVLANETQQPLPRTCPAPDTCARPHRRSTLVDLPPFGGRAEDWPFFICSYETTTAEYGYTDLENMSRLQKALVGEAKTRARGILIRPEHVGRTIFALARAFGRPETLAESQMNEIAKLPKISENRPEQLISFSITVDSMVSLLDGPATAHLLYNSLLLGALIAKLPSTDQRNWAAVSRHIHPMPSICDFARWLAEVAEDVVTMKSYHSFDNVQPRSREPRPPPSRGRHVLFNVTNTKPERRAACAFCGEPHHIDQCEAFRKLSVIERLDEARKRPLCFYCLSDEHFLPGCEERKMCGRDGCKRFHHKLLHETGERSERQRTPNPQSTGTAQQKSRPPKRTKSDPQPAPAKTLRRPQQESAAMQQADRYNGTNSVCHLGPYDHDGKQKQKQSIYYRIVPVVLFGPAGRLQTYALYDEGSSVSLVDAELADELGLDGETQTLTMQFVGGSSAAQPSRSVTLGISGIDADAVRFNIASVLTTSNLSLPLQSIDKGELLDDNPHLADVPLVSYSNVRPKILLGLEHHYLGVPIESRISENPRRVTAARTRLGWTLYGCDGHPTLPSAVVLHARRPDVGEEADLLHELVRHHFTTEGFGVKTPIMPIVSDADQRALTILESTTKRRGVRFETGLLWKRDDIVLPDSYQMAANRLKSVEARMQRDPEYAEQYRRQIEAYVSKGYARRMTPKEVAKKGPRTWYLPHFAVLNANKPGKFRLVFDAAATSHRTSLIDMLLAGPDLNVPLTRLLFRFRLGAVGVCGDVREMFHQVMVRKEDQDAQRFLWRDNAGDAEPSVYVMEAMTFGSTCSPTAAQFVKNKNAECFAGQYPEAAAAIIRNHYVDDYVISFRTTDDAQRITEEVIDLHARGGFELRGILSNCPAIRQRFGDDTTKPSSVCLEPPDMTQKILGMEWETSDDCFIFKTRFNRVNPSVLDGSRRPTKREMLSFIMSIYDPFGLLANFLLPSKVLLQELWRLGVEWDEPVPMEIDKRWQSWRKLVVETRRVRIPRCYSKAIMDAPLQLHIFADASEEAFAASAYWRVEGVDGTELAFVCGKVRCAPLKLLSIPRLELQAAVLATRLMLEIRRTHEELSIEKIVFWSDSETVLKWLRCDQRRYVPFVAHRVAEVVESAPAHWWRWVPSAQNVADDATRVPSPLTFDPESRWLRGPAWLRNDERSWPVQKLGPDAADVAATEELRPKYVGFVAKRGAVDFHRFSQFMRLVRCIAWVKRFVTNARVGRVAGELSADEIKKATHQICRWVQQEEYAAEITALKAGRSIGDRSRVFLLKPYLDVEGVMRLHGRTDAAKDEFVPKTMKRPIIMPREHYVTMLIVRHHHVLHAHQLTDATIASVRHQFWVPQIRTLVNKVRHGCQLCRIRSTKAQPPSLGQLPADRLEAYARPFTNTGLDFFGPFFVTIGRRTEKRWVALFTCLVVRAVHLEVAADLSTDACLQCIRNLCHLRGVPSVIRCDNGTNFVGAKNEIQRHPDFFNVDAMQRELAVSGVTWKFNCPANPEAGGAWERLVQTVKRVLAVVLHERAPHVETFRSALLEAANIVNSRPLTHLSVDPDDPEPLTPNHFLFGGPNRATAPDLQDEEPMATRRQWRIGQGISRRFWSQFVRDYMPELTRRNKHYPTEPELAVGDLVVICDEQQQRGLWSRGVIAEVAKGTDGVVRTATVRTVNGLYRRPVTRLAKLIVSSPDGFDERGAVSRLVPAKDAD